MKILKENLKQSAAELGLVCCFVFQHNDDANQRSKLALLTDLHKGLIILTLIVLGFCAIILVLCVK